MSVIAVTCDGDGKALISGGPFQPYVPVVSAERKCLS